MSEGGSAGTGAGFAPHGTPDTPRSWFRGGLVFEAHIRLYHLRLKDLLGPVTRVKQQKKKGRAVGVLAAALRPDGSEEGSYLRLIDLCITQL